jgi:hypothetical protein
MLIPKRLVQGGLSPLHHLRNAKGTVPGASPGHLDK